MFASELSCAQSDLEGVVAGADVAAVVTSTGPSEAGKDNMDHRVDIADVETVIVGCNKSTDSIDMVAWRSLWSLG